MQAPQTEALQSFLSRLIDDTELLGSSVRMNFEKAGVVWEPVEYGVQRTNLSLGTAAEKQAAMGYLTLLWQLLAQRPAQALDDRLQPLGVLDILIAPHALL